MTRKEINNWKDMGVQPRGIRLLRQINKDRAQTGTGPQITTDAVNHLLQKHALIAELERAPRGLSPQDVHDSGYTYRLTFQRSTADPKMVRAVIKDLQGSVIATGDVVKEELAAKSRCQAIVRQRYPK